MTSIIEKKNIILSFLLVLGFVAANSALAQTPTPSPTAASSDGSYEIASSVELGIRGLDINGNSDKYRSDLNYRAGFRIFDSSFLIENKSKNGSFFDSALVTSSGWGSDPNGTLRASLEKAGAYRFDANVRRVKYFNNLPDHARGLHTANTKHTFGDFDVTIFPEWDLFRLRLGYSFNRTKGPVGFSTSTFRDIFGLEGDVENSSDDFRIGGDTKLLGFKIGLAYGYRKFDENNRYFITEPLPGLTPGAPGALTTFERLNPISGSTHFGNFHAQRTFAKKVDMTVRVIYAETDTESSLEDTFSGRDHLSNFIDSDVFEISSSSKRPQTRADLGVTYLVTERFRISNTLTFDQFSIGGANILFEEQIRRNSLGVPIAPVIDNKLYDRFTSYRRISNLVEGDYQVNSKFAFNLGYRYSHRKVAIEGVDIDFDTPSTSPLEPEEFSNSTHALIAGVKVKPMKNWSIFGDVEHGRADNVFTRTANYEYTNFRIRSRANINQFGFNVSFITKDNNNPTRTEDIPPMDFGADIRTRIFSTSVDWVPSEKLVFNAGYSYHYITSEAVVRVPVMGVRLIGLSSYFVRDHSFNIDVSAKPIRRLSLFAAYRINDDGGQGDRIGVLPDIISSYPMRFQSPEFRAAIRLTRNIDWNIGYQYYDYEDTFLPAQNYNAHLPYTSLRIYFGKGAGDR
jgi:hypothetical protein